MSKIDFVRLVAEMRAAQRAYFQGRSAEALETSKRLERAVDRATEELLCQPTLSDLEGP